MTKDEIIQESENVQQLVEYANSCEERIYNDTDRYISKRLTKMELMELRKSQKLTQKQIADATGLSIRCISDIESETSGNPTLNNLIKYLECLGYEICFQKKSI